VKRLRVLCLAPLLGVAGIMAPTASGCATGSAAGAVGFRVESNVVDATVWVDDRLVGSASDWARPGKRIRSGFHRVEIRHPGYYSVFQEIELPDGAQTVVKAQLRPLVE
jgi:hypothetical protein